jgi:maltose O-acetyltransferase
MMRLCGASIATGVKVNAGCIMYNRFLQIGRNTWIGPQCVLFSGAGGPILIGQDCDIGPGTMFVTGTHEIGTSARRAGRGYSVPLRVGDGCWIGARCTILGGAQIGDGCIVAAGALVRAGAYPSNSLIAGVPARVIKEYFS